MFLRIMKAQVLPEGNVFVLLFVLNKMFGQEGKFQQLVQLC